MIPRLKNWLQLHACVILVSSAKMANRCALMLLKPNVSSKIAGLQSCERLLHSSPALLSVQAGKVKISPKKNKPVTYEDAFSPPHIAHRKSWNSWNTSTIEGGLRPAETAIEDLFIRKFLDGTFPGNILSKVIIKRQHNIIRIAALVNGSPGEARLCFLMGYTETLLSYWLHCNVKLELQILLDPKKTIFKYV